MLLTILNYLNRKNSGKSKTSENSKNSGKSKKSGEVKIAEKSKKIRNSSKIPKKNK